ncbi:MAG: hypothetical protein KatS3mg102_1872 [Planctomycetota bacterium]|nr:MAG: hypothetical protein KatS3mg102_1872 [Planctomycetota bacterium]
MRLFEEAERLAPARPEPAYNLACAHALRGAAEEAIGWLEQALARGFDDAAHIARDPDLDSIRDDPRFRAVLVRHFGEPPAPLSTLEGRAVRLEQLRGKVVVVLVWKADLEPVRAALPHLVRLKAELGALGLEVVGISPEPPDVQQQLAAAHKVNFLLLRQREGTSLPAPLDHAVQAPAVLYVLDRGGRLVHKLTGPAPFEDLAALVQPLLPEQAPPERVQAF